MALFGAVAVLFLTLDSAPDESAGFPTELSEFLDSGKGEINLSSMAPNAQYLCVFGGYQALQTALANAGITSTTTGPYIKENEFLVALDYGNDKIEYELRSNRGLAPQVFFDFSKCVSTTNGLILYLEHDAHAHETLVRYSTNKG